MVDFAPAHVVASEAGILLVAAIFTPVAALLLAVLAGPSYVRIIAGAALGLGLAIAAAIVATFLMTGEPIVYHLGGWPPPRWASRSAPMAFPSRCSALRHSCSPR